ncbi:outer membrane beta-barrel protein [Bacteroides sp. UBA939]|uniref:outer membrane beta-barrel protein n=1 Tax=Bacteroides sp. UBA939 TaxID=1946092 RepID=UPI0025BFB4BF|nr:outer membrane beta-barrel protein [Bacteroides sp. UBA939]
MKGNDEITGLFRSRLTGAEMTVRDGFWEELQGELSAIEADTPNTSAAVASGQAVALPQQKQRRFVFTPRFYRGVAAASVIFVLGIASAAFWYFSPKEEIQEAFTKVATLTPEGSLNGDVVQEKFPSIHETKPVAHKSGNKHPGQASSATVLAVNEEEDDESVSVTVSITITQRVFGNHQQGGNGMYGQNASQNENGYHRTADSANTISDMESGVHSENTVSVKEVTGSSKDWALEAGVGTSLPEGSFGMPFTAGVSAERRLNKCFSLEAGLQYNRLDANRVIHTLAVPVKLNAILASNPKVDFYATLGGAAEKCIAGAGDNGFGAEPVQLSVAAGLGVRYKLNDRIALFAEPTVSHYFDTDSQTKTLYTERSMNFNLLCGVRMIY